MNTTPAKNIWLGRQIDQPRFLISQAKAALKAVSLPLGRAAHTLGVTILASVLVILSSAVSAEPTRAYLFDVYFDERLVGTHRFERTETDEGQEVITSDANFQLKVLFFNAFQYRHKSREVWQDGCLVELKAETESRRGAEKTTLKREGSESRLIVNGEEKLMPEGSDCTWTFAYWRQDLVGRTHLMNAQSGDLVPVQIEAQPPSENSGDQRINISSEKLDIDVVYDADGHWIGLETALPKDHRLTYRLQPSYASAK